MAGRKAHPELVNPELARQAVANAKGDRMTAFTQYIIVHFHSTGDLAPGIDARDFYAWYDANEASQ